MAPSPTGTAFCIAFSAQPEQTRGVLEAQRARGAKRRIFAERVAGDEGRLFRHTESGFALERAKRCHGDGHQRRLRVGGQRQFGLGAFEHQMRQLLRERRVDAFEDLPGGGKRLSERLAPIT